MDHTLQLVKLAHNGDKNAREQAVNENMGLVINIAKRYIGRGTEIEDLIQIGCIGLLKAIDHFDLNYEVRFSTYAVPMISGEIKRFLRDDGIIKVSRTMKKTAFLTSQVRERLMNQYGRDPTLEEISKESGIAVEDIIFAMESSAEIESLQKTLYQSDGNQILLEDRIEEKDNPQEHVVNHVMITELLEKLDEDERNLIQMRYYQEMTQSQVAEKMKKTQVQISRLEKKILNKLKACIL